MPGWYEHWSTMLTRPVRRIAQAAVVTTLVAGAVGVSHYDKSVNPVSYTHLTLPTTSRV